jgi:hypothetical protein
MVTTDLEINFEYNSDKIGQKAMPQVTALGEALASSELKGRPHRQYLPEADMSVLAPYCD